jgi:putative nucleotidyltransferase with HDIG domain
VDSESLIKHSLAVEAAMRAYAKKYSENGEKWGICGLLHDFDYEKWPETHPEKGVQILKEENYPEDIIEAIESHVDGTSAERNILMAKTLYAVDELSGLIYALAHIRPTNLEGMKPKSVKKALKKKGFAAGINREDIERGIKELEVEKSEHFEVVIKALQEISNELGF